MSQITIAPAFMNGFLGIPFSYSSWNNELKEFPDGSTPTLFHKLSPSIVKARHKERTFDIL